MKEIKVLYICPSPTYYGDNIALMNIIPNLKKKGVNPFFLVQREGDFTAILKKKGYRYGVCEFTYNNLYSLYRPLYSYISHAIKSFVHDFRLRKKIRVAISLLEDFAPDIIHSNNSANRFGLLLSEQMNIPHVWHLREYMDKDHNKGFFPSKTKFERFLNHTNNSCISVSPDVALHYSTKCENRVIYDGVIPQTKEQLPLVAKEDVMLFVGRLVETKGIFEIADAFAFVAKHHPSYELWYIGDGSKEVKESIFAIARNHNLEDRVKILGYKSNVFEYMKKAKAIVVSSRYEAFGFITAEAMFNGCIVIGRNTAGTKMQFDNGLKYTNKEIGFRYNNHEELEEAMEQVMSATDEELYGKLVNAYITVLHFYTTTGSADRVFDYYMDILK